LGAPGLKGPPKLKIKLKWLHNNNNAERIKENVNKIIEIVWLCGGWGPM